MGAAARVDGATQPETGVAIGFEVRAAAGWRWLGVAATAGVLAPTDSRFSAVTVRQQRFPLSLAFTARHRLGERLAVAGAVGAALVPLTLRADGIDGASSSTRLDAGVRLALELAFLATPRLAPFIGIHAEIFPRAYELDVGPPGTRRQCRIDRPVLVGRVGGAVVRALMRSFRPTPQKPRPTSRPSEIQVPSTA